MLMLRNKFEKYYMHSLPKKKHEIRDQKMMPQNDFLLLFFDNLKIVHAVF